MDPSDILISKAANGFLDAGVAACRSKFVFQDNPAERRVDFAKIFFEAG